jgi:alpha-amylase
MTSAVHLNRWAVIGLVAVMLLASCAEATVAPTSAPARSETPATPATRATPAIVSRTPGPAVTPPQPIAGGLTPRWWDGCIFYLILVRSFYDADGDGYGDLQGLIEKLDYLNDGNPNTDTDLGINALWLMPVYKSPTYHGYAPSDYYVVEPHYGDNDTFRRFVSEAHQRGIYVIVDMGLNHTSEKHPWFLDAISSVDAEHRDWYVWADADPQWRGPGQRAVWFLRNDDYYYAFFGSALPDLNLRNEAVSAQMLDVIRFWLQDMGVDGFRLDAIRHVIEEGNEQESTPATHRWLKGFGEFYKSLEPNALAIGEVTGPTSERLPYYDSQVDMCFEFAWADAAVSSLDRGDPAELEAKQSLIQAVYPQGQYGTFLALQDHNRIISELRDSLPKARLAATLLLTSPGVPFMYYGEEIGMRGRKPDVYIRRPMQWANKLRAGFSAGRPWMDVDLNYDVVNVETQSADPNSLLNHYRRLIRLRLKYRALRDGEWTPLRASNSRVYAYLRHAEDADILVVLNFSDEAIDGCELEARLSSIQVGDYKPSDLLGNESIAPFTANAIGGFSGYQPLLLVEPLTGYVILIRGGRV